MDVLQSLDGNAMYDPCVKTSVKSVATIKTRRASKRHTAGHQVEICLIRKTRTAKVNKRVQKLKRVKPATTTFPIVTEDEQEHPAASQTLDPSPICPVMSASQISDNTPVLVTPAKACGSVSTVQHSCCSRLSLSFLPQTPYQADHQPARLQTSTQPRLASPAQSRLAGRRMFALGKVTTDPDGANGKITATKHFLSAMPRDSDPLVQECMRVKASSGWFFPCRGCMQVTGQEYSHYVTIPTHASAAVPSVPLCQACSGRITSMPADLRYQAECQLLQIHSNWSAFGQ